MKKDFEAAEMKVVMLADTITTLLNTGSPEEEEKAIIVPEEWPEPDPELEEESAY